MGNTDRKERPIEDKIRHIHFSMGLFGYGVDFLIENGAPASLWERYNAAQFRTVVQAAVEAGKIELPAGADVLTLSRKDLSDDQKRIIDAALLRASTSRTHRYIESIYFATFEAFLDAFSDMLNIDDDSNKAIDNKLYTDICDAASYINCYFYVSHEEIDPRDKSDYSTRDDLKEEVTSLTKKIIAYKAEHGGSYYESARHCLGISSETLEKITEISRADFFGLPLSKIWSSQGIISAEGAEGREINVGKKTASGSVIVKASISGKDGEPLDIDEVQKGVQRAVGNLVYEAGGKIALPIIITPQQIYRAFARLPADATVTEQQAAEMEKAMDVLMYAPVSLNFTAQLERHKHIKQDPDYDYQGEQAGKLGGTLIPAQKMEAETRGGARNVAYKIYDVPVLYMYSKAINQLAWVPNALLTGSGKPPVKTAKSSEAQGTARGVAVKENVLSRVYRMIERQQKKERYNPLVKVDDVAEDCGIALTEKTRRTLRKNIGLYLEELKTQGKIKDYQETKSGREIAGYTVKP